MTGKGNKLAVALALLGLILAAAVRAQTTAPTAVPAVAASDSSSLQSLIDQRNQDIQNLEKEIAGYQKQIDSLGSQATSLSSTLQSLQLTKKKLEANIRVTEDKIAAKNLEIKQLGSDISDKQGSIDDDRRVILQTFTALDQSGNQSLLEIMLGSDSLGNAMKSLDQIATLQNSIRDRIAKLNADKTSLQTNKQASEKAQADLVSLNNDLKNQRAVVLATAAQETDLLNQTKQSESSYRKILAQKQALKDAFEQELLNYESQLHLNVNSAALPHTGSGVLSWPLSGTYPGSCPSPSGYASCITQYFGNTPFATANPQLYNGKGHTGVDFRASIGTPVKAALSGVIVGMADTDLVPGCYSYGQWIMIKHPNGLSTLYGHLSLEMVHIGDEVTTGQVIAYSGNTGYTTGPHLHFGVYATQGVEIKKFDTSKNCKGATIPIADFSAYLNPLSYL